MTWPGQEASCPCSLTLHHISCVTVSDLVCAPSPTADTHFNRMSEFESEKFLFLPTCITQHYFSQVQSYFITFLFPNSLLINLVSLNLEAMIIWWIQPFNRHFIKELFCFMPHLEPMMQLSLQLCVTLTDIPRIIRLDEFYFACFAQCCNWRQNAALPNGNSAAWIWERETKAMDAERTTSLFPAHRSDAVSEEEEEKEPTHQVRTWAQTVAFHFEIGFTEDLVLPA